MSNEINLTAWYFLQGLYTGGYVADFTASSCLFGLVSALAAMSALLLVRKGVAQHSVRVLLAATVALYISTCVYFGYTQSLYSAMNKTISDAASNLFNPGSVSFTEDYIRMVNMGTVQKGTTAATLTVNMLISDMIVWWRALVIWPRNRLVWCIGAILILTTGALGIVTTYQNFPQGYSTVPPYGGASNGFKTQPQAMAYDPIGVACTVLSLATNVIATALIGYKTWVHRRTLQKLQIGGKVMHSRAVSVLMFIVESGVGYCLLWVVIASYLGISLKSYDTLNETENRYVAFMEHFVLRGLVPLIAMYPMAIIIIVTVNQSPIDHLCISLQSY